jgi:hypothetical protein
MLPIGGERRVLSPIIIEYAGVLVVCDDLFLGGTKARFLSTLFDGADESR